MLQEICEEIHNYFIKVPRRGRYEITDGRISLPFLQDGQKFLIVGSTFNDGLYTYHNDWIGDDDNVVVEGLQDETWAGTICALAVPPAVIALSEEIKAWVDKYGEQANSPFTSEAVIGVYSYEKQQKSRVSGESPVLSWQDIYKKRLDRWRKVSF